MTDELIFAREERAAYTIERAETERATILISSPMLPATTPYENQWFWEVAPKDADPNEAFNGYAATRELAVAAAVSSLRVLLAGGRRGD